MADPIKTKGDNMKKGTPKYIEPAEYFPITIRKKHKLGEFAGQEICGEIKYLRDPIKKPTKKTTK